MKYVTNPIVIARTKLALAELSPEPATTTPSPKTQTEYMASTEFKEIEDLLAPKYKRTPAQKLKRSESRSTKTRRTRKKGGCEHGKQHSRCDTCREPKARERAQTSLKVQRRKFVRGQLANRVKRAKGRRDHLLVKLRLLTQNLYLTEQQARDQEARIQRFVEEQIRFEVRVAFFKARPELLPYAHVPHRTPSRAKKKKWTLDVEPEVYSAQEAA